MLVRRGGTVLVEGGFGYADRARDVAATPATAFQVASLSKQFTAAAAVVLAARGALSTEDTIARWFATSPPEWAGVTLHHLLTNTSGIGHWQDYPEIDLYRPTTAAELLETVFRRPLAFAPGSGWRYSSLGFVLAAHVVERASGMPYPTFLERTIFAPLGMDATAAGSAPRGGGAVGHSGGEPVPSFELETVGMGAGDVWSSVGDLGRWSSALALGSLPTGESLAPLVAPHARVAPDVAYGYGCFLGRIHGRDAVYHPGDNRGFRAFAGWLPADDVFVAVLTNDDRTDAEAIGRRLVDVLARSGELR